MRSVLSFAVVALSGVLLAGCSLSVSSDVDSSHQHAASPVAAAPASGAAPDAQAEQKPMDQMAHVGVMAHMPWSRPLAPGANVAAGYAHLMNHSSKDERLVSARAEGVGRVEIHTMSEVDGVMQMRPLDGGLALPVNSMAKLQPGGDHLMFFEVTRSWNEGDSVPVTLVFESGLEVPVDFAVKQGTAAAKDEHQHH